MALNRRRASALRLLTPALLVASALLLTPGPAAAWHDRDAPVTDYSAETLRNDEWRIYLGTLVEYGLTDDWEIGTTTGLDLVTFFNVTSKYTVWRGDTFAFAASAGLYTISPSVFGGPDVQLWLVPVSLYGSWREPAGDYSAHLALNYTNLTTAGSGSVESVEIDGVLEGVTINLVPTFEWRRSRSFAWVFQSTISLLQAGRAGGDSTFESDDGRTRLDVYGEGTVRTGAFAFGNVSASAYWSWESFNLRLGLGYGHVELPLVGLLFDQVLVQPEFNMYWRF
ncbi:MAG: hypothetical protein H6705_20510 [Myxococcales bacterium]|nr:hypothetical protein [Myxococcales bacterium]